ncbi:MAG: TIGR03619 family F420-dependent LLM class oxidoreductase [Gammaproteobacteria bacterium]|jgi:probable F420-dependent oxidoreductase
MKIGTTIRNMGPAATRDCMLACARAAEAAALDHIWTVDHIAIPPDDAEGSNGRYLDPLASLAFLAAATSRIGLGIAVLVVPYRPALPTAKWIATIQELAGGRLHFGVGPGWMKPEFRALGVPHAARGRLTDETLTFIQRCFSAEDDVVSVNGQEFLFRPRPAMPPLYVGGMSEAALQRAVRFGDGWLPIGLDTEKLQPRIKRLRELAEAAGRECPEIITLGSLPESDDAALAGLAACAELGVSQFIQSSRYDNPTQFEATVERLLKLRDAVA